MASAFWDSGQTRNGRGRASGGLATGSGSGTGLRKGRSLASSLWQSR